MATAREKKELFFKKAPEILNRFFEKYYLFILAGLTVVLLFTLIASVVESIDKPNEFFPPLVLSAAALIAILAYWREHNNADLNKKRSRSEFFFRQASSGLDEALELLKNKNNDRVLWVRAARSLIQAQKLADEIELEEFRRAYQLHADRIRNDLYLALTVYNPETRDRQPLPPQFFYGTRDWKEEKPLNDVAIEVSQKIEAHSLTLDKMYPDPNLFPLLPQSVCVVFDFMDYPEDYKNLLDEVQVWDANLWVGVFGEKRGAAKYIAHQAKYFTVDKKIFERKKEVENQKPKTKTLIFGLSERVYVGSNRRVSPVWRML